jgi:hypothetical protein
LQNTVHHQVTITGGDALCIIGRACHTFWNVRALLDLQKLRKNLLTGRRQQER